jgi:cobalt-zinc-cadmium efflux system protein
MKCFDCNSCNPLQGKLPIPNTIQRSSKLRLLIIGLLLSGSFSFIEYSVGWQSHSLALVVDSGHLFLDCFAMALALLATGFAQAAANHRIGLEALKAEKLAAIVNGISLLVLAIWVIWEAIIRFHVGHPTILSGTMLLTAIMGLGFNLVTVSLLHDHSHTDLNVRGAFLHALADTLSSVGVLLAALLIWLLHWNWADEVISMLTAGLIAMSALPLIDESVKAWLNEAAEY